MKNLQVNIIIPSGFSKKMVHRSVSFLKSELNFNLRSLVINFVSTEEIIKINSEYLKHQFSTDIITFRYSETNDDIDGEIYISVADAANNANRYKNSIKTEIVRLITHGILHLLGFDDQDTLSKRKMKLKENELVRKQIIYGVNDN